MSISEREIRFKLKKLSEYDLQGEVFCKATGLEIVKHYVGHRAYFNDDEERRAVWSITFTRKGRKSYSFTYGDSIANSYKKFRRRRGRRNRWPELRQPIHPVPTDYDILACVEKCGLRSFSEFCDEYGYDSDSIKARDTWQAVQEQASAIEAMFSLEELLQLQEIQ